MALFEPRPYRAKCYLPHPKSDLMNRILYLFFLIVLLAACKDEGADENCAPWDIEWQSRAFPGDAYLWLSGEDGEWQASLKLTPQLNEALATEQCEGPVHLSYLEVRPEVVKEGSNTRTETVYELTTWLDVPTGFSRDTAARAPLREWPVAIGNVSSLQSLIWPEDNLQAFSGNIFLDPAAELLSFAIQVPDTLPAYAFLQANGEALPRYFWVGKAQDSAFVLDYEALPQLMYEAPVQLPNTANWFYEIYGEGENGQALIDFASMPDLVSGSFAPRVPVAGISGFRLKARQVGDYQGWPYAPNAYDRSGSRIPESVPALPSAPGMARNGDTLQVGLFNGSFEALTAYEVQLVDFRGEGPWLRWTIIGSVEGMARLVLPQWPEALSAARAQLLAPGRQTIALIGAKAYESQPAYQALLEAWMQGDEGWESRQGLTQRTAAQDF